MSTPCTTGLENCSQGMRKKSKNNIGMILFSSHIILHRMIILEEALNRTNRFGFLIVKTVHSSFFLH
jgi:hypothetical protein